MDYKEIGFAVLRGLIIGIIVGMVMGLSGCSSTPLQKHRIAILDCVKDLRQNQFSSDECERICQNVYSDKSCKTD